MSSERNSNNFEVLFTARVDNVKSLLQILRAINFKDVSFRLECLLKGMPV